MTESQRLEALKIIERMQENIARMRQAFGQAADAAHEFKAKQEQGK